MTRKGSEEAKSNQILKIHYAASIVKKILSYDWTNIKEIESSEIDSTVYEDQAYNKSNISKH